MLDSLRRGRLVPRRLLDCLGFGNGDGGVGFSAQGSATSALHSLPDDFGDWLVNRTRVRFLLGNAELWQHVDDRMRRNLKLPGKLVDANFTHT